MKPLSLPRPKGGGWIVLIGGGEFSFGETREIDEFSLSHLTRNKTIAFLPTASGSNEYAVHLATYFQQLDPEVSLVNVPIYRPRDARRVKHCQTLANAGMIYIGGGVTNSIADTLKGSPAQTAILDALSDGAVLAAIGAGAAVLGRVAADHFRPGGSIAGLDLVQGAAIVTGFSSEEDLIIRALTSLPEVSFGIGIPARTAVGIAPDGSGKILGAGSIALIRKGAGEVVT